MWTIETYLAWRTGIAPTRARQIATIARRATDLPSCVTALRAGELSVDQVAAIATKAPAWTDTQICALAKNLTVTQLRRVVSHYRFPDPDDHPDTGTHDADTERATTEPADTDTDPTTTPAEPSAPTDVCWFHLGDDDRFRLYLETDALTGALIDTALTETRDRLFRHHGDEQPDVDWVDVLREVAHRSLDTITEPARRDRHRIHLHLDTDATATDTIGWTIPDAIRRHLTCDGTLTPIFTTNSIPTSVGRQQRIVPERTRRLIIHRDRGCRVPGCTNHRFLEIHHIIHWLDAGPTDTSNLLALCPHHHRLHHHGTLGITGNADDPNGVTFTLTNGNPIHRTGANPTPPHTPPPKPSGTYHHPLGERLHTRWLHFNPPPRPHTPIHQPPNPN